MAKFKGTFSEVHIDPVKLAAVMRGPKGPVMRDLFIRAERVRVRAKELVGKDTHDLEKSIVKRPVQDARGLAFEVGSTLPYAKLHHDGTKPHVIEPRNARVLRFPVKGVGIVFAMRVNHPGTKPNRYLTDALKEAQKATVGTI